MPRCEGRRMTQVYATRPYVGTRFAPIALVVFVAVALTGVPLAFSLLSSRPAVAPAGVATGAGPFGVGQTVQTASAYLTVEFVQPITGLSDTDLSGATHGINGLVQSDHSQIQVNVRLRNRASSALDFGPEQFSLVAGSGAPIAPSASTLLRGSLPASANIAGHLGFVVPRDGSSLRLAYQDPAGGSPTLVDLGNGRL